jgi:hypothetical protein
MLNINILCVYIYVYIYIDRWVTVTTGGVTSFAPVVGVVPI